MCACVDVDECLGEEYGSELGGGGSVCGEGQCVNVDGGFECRCADGYAPGVDGTCEGLYHT